MNLQQITLDQEKLVNNGYLTISNNKSEVNEQFRQIKRTILNKAFGTAIHPAVNDKANLVLVTSPNKGEGKTFTAVNLALSSALEKDKTVLLIDANVINPGFYYTLNFNANKGLVEYLIGEVSDLSDVIYDTNIPNLKIIPAGTPNFLTNELLASERMSSLTDELSQRYKDRLVLFDSPELIGVTETSVLSAFVGQAIIVAESGKTSMASIKKAHSMLEKHIEIGVVFNKKSPR